MQYVHTHTHTHTHKTLSSSNNCSDCIAAHEQTLLTGHSYKVLILLAEYDKVKLKTLQSGQKSFKILRGHLRLSTFALTEIQAFQQRTDLLIPRKPFLR